MQLTIYSNVQQSDLHGIVAELGRLKHFIADSLPAAAADGAGAPAAAVVDTSALETELHALKEDTGVVRYAHIVLHCGFVSLLTDCHRYVLQK